MKAVFGASAGSRPGIYARDDPWWAHRLYDPEHDREGFGALRCVIAEDDDGPRGYALFAIQPSWPDDALPRHRLNVREICALDPASYGLVWRHLLDRDLVATVSAPTGRSTTRCCRWSPTRGGCAPGSATDSSTRSVDVPRGAKLTRLQRPGRRGARDRGPRLPVEPWPMAAAADTTGASCTQTTQLRRRRRCRCRCSARPTWAGSAWSEPRAPVW